MAPATRPKITAISPKMPAYRYQRPCPVVKCTPILTREKAMHRIVTASGNQFTFEVKRPVERLTRTKITQGTSTSDTTLCMWNCIPLRGCGVYTGALACPGAGMKGELGPLVEARFEL